MLTTRSGKLSKNQPVNDATAPASAVATSPDQSFRDSTTSDPHLLEDEALMSVDLDDSESSTAKGTASGAASGVQAEAENDNVQERQS